MFFVTFCPELVFDAGFPGGQTALKRIDCTVEEARRKAEISPIPSR
jgi:hypothetical protein